MCEMQFLSRNFRERRVFAGLRIGVFWSTRHLADSA